MATISDSSFDVRASPDSPQLAFSGAPEETSVTHLLAAGHSGLDLTSWTRTYGGAYVREVTWPTLVGPFHSENEYVCGYTLQLGAALFDTSGAGKGLNALVQDQLAKSFPRKIKGERIEVVLSPFARSDLSIRLDEGRIGMSVIVHLVDSTILEATFQVRLLSRDGTPYIERVREAPLRTRFAGPSVDRIIAEAKEKGAGVGGLGGCGVGAVLGGPVGCAILGLIGAGLGSSAGEDKAEAAIPGKVRDQAAERIDSVLSDLTLGLENLRQPFHPVTSRPTDVLRLRLAADPEVSRSGITLPICAQVLTGNPRVEPAIAGPVAAAPAERATVERPFDGSGIRLALNADGLNQIVYYLWQAGFLRQAGESSLVFDSLSREVRMAAFDFIGLDPGLPPTLQPSASDPGTLPFAIGDVRLGSIGQRKVVGHGRVLMSFVQNGDAIALQGRVADVRVNCTESTTGRTELTPCLNDLLPVLRDIAAARPPPAIAFAGADLLGKLPKLSFQGAHLRLSDLRIAAAGSPASLALTANASIE